MYRITEEQWNNERAINDLAKEIVSTIREGKHVANMRQCGDDVRITGSPPKDLSLLAAVLVDRKVGPGEVRMATRGKPTAVYTVALPGTPATGEARGMIIMLDGAAGEELYMFNIVSARYLIRGNQWERLFSNSDLQRKVSVEVDGASASS